ncbi:hypothetical protein B0H16DRAFT_539978 [Mycena metata]|uniref:Uncharacterized protein n=1 Tax=Mycena metata TaxID=1033252 RepID=A0AAD7JCY3_9AGAR|nr:hypothetical protein B0H16DRAFT_539978 [Mycena metata]
MSTIQSGEPRLPADLEREILTTAASVLPIRHIPNIILVARRVQIWVTPMLYRSFVVCNSPPSEDSLTLRRTPNEFRRMISLSPTAAAADIHSLCIPDWLHSGQIGDFLNACSGIETLAIFGISVVVPTLLPALAKMPLRRLSLELLPLFGAVPGLDFTVDFRHQIFSRLTHLTIQDIPEENPDPGMWAGLVELPFLTHLAFTNWHLPPIFNTILAQCQALQVFVLKCSAVHIAHTEGLGYFAHDPRAVVLVVKKFQEDWEAGVDGGQDFWKRAEKFLEKRRTGEIDGLSSFITVSAAHTHLNDLEYRYIAL